MAAMYLEPRVGDVMVLTTSGGLTHVCS
jgi:hypothetical protein